MGREGPPAGPDGVGRPSWRVERGWEAHLDSQGVWKPPHNGQEEMAVPHGGRERL